MAVAREYIHDVVEGTCRSGDRARVLHPAGSLAGVRRVVRSGLVEFIDLAPWESRVDVEAAGQTGRPGRTADVVFADFEMIHAGTPQQVAGHLLSLCRPGGRIAIACPVPGSFVAEIHACIARYVANAGYTSRGFTGTREGLDALFGGSAIALGARDRSLTLRFSSAEHWLADWGKSYAPLRHAYTHVDPDWRDQFTNELLGIVRLYAEKTRDGMLVVRSDYLEFIVHTGRRQ